MENGGDPEYETGLIPPEENEQEGTPYITPDYESGAIPPPEENEGADGQQYYTGLIIPEEEQEDSSSEDRRPSNLRPGRRNSRRLGRRGMCTCQRPSHPFNRNRGDAIVLVDNIGTNRLASAFKRFRLGKEGNVTVSFIAYTFARERVFRNRKALLEVTMNGASQVIQLGAGVSRVNLNFRGRRGFNFMKFTLEGAALSRRKVQTTITFFQISQQ